MVDFVKLRPDNSMIGRRIETQMDREPPMAENESLDLDSSPRMRVVFNAFHKGASGQKVVAKLENALIGGLRKALKQFKQKGVLLGDLLKSRDSPQALSDLVRKTEGHDYARLFADAAAISAPTDTDCLAGWINAVLDKMTDQICHRVAGSENWPTIDDVQAFIGDVREKLTPVVDRLVTKLADDPTWQPKRAPTKGQGSVDGTAELMGLSLLGRPSQ
jgi:hypothetical protein